MSLHRCTDTDCCYIGLASPRGCGCHQTDEQMLRESHAALLAVLCKLERWFDTDEEIIAAMGDDERADHVRQLAMIRAAIATAKWSTI